MRSQRVCLLTPGQPSNNPRLVKEADALVESGRQVHVICTDSGLWPTEKDVELLSKRRWTCQYVGGVAKTQPVRRLATRLRQRVACKLLSNFPNLHSLRNAAASRCAPEIQSAAFQYPARLYIAHHATVLPVAVAAAQRHGGLVGYDAEDFYAGLWRFNAGPETIDRLIERIEQTHLSCCAYITAASPGIAAEYARKYGCEKPIVVLNTFPLADRPPAYRPTELNGSLRLYWFSQCIGKDRGLEDAVRALGLLKNCAIQLHLRGNWQAGYRENLYSLAQEQGVADRLFAHPPADPDAMIRLSAEHDVGLALEQRISPNDDLRLTNKVFTHLIAGNAIIGTQTGAQQAFLSSLGSSSTIYPSGGSEHLAVLIYYWYHNRSALDQARRNSWDWGTKRYNWEIEKQSFLTAVSNVIHSKSALPTLC